MGMEVMKPGRELDALVAEKVIGKKHNQPGTMGGDLDELYGMAAPHYSTDIAAAWEVVEKMRELGWGSSIMSYLPEPELEAHCRAEFRSKRGEYRALSKEAPAAICLAALKAFGA